MADEEKNPQGSGGGGGFISGIINGIGGVVHGFGAIQQANVDDTCGKKPGIFAPRKDKDDYNECLRKSAEAKIEMMKAQAAQAKIAQDTSSKNKTIIVASVVFGVVILTVVLAVVISRKRQSAAA